MEFLMDNKRVAAAQKWILNSISACDFRGSSALYHPINGWERAYPETTGYLIPTFLQTAQKNDRNKWLKIAKDCGDWLCSIQLENGHFPGGVGGTLSPNIFDTGQILLGLTHLWEWTKYERYLLAIQKSLNVLVGQLSVDGSWKADAYLDNYIPTYYTRVIWAILHANQYLRIPDVEKKMKNALAYNESCINENGTVRNWAFGPGEPAFTHTIAYVIRGFLECGLLLKESRYIDLAESLTRTLLTHLDKHGQMAGSYDEDWNGDFSFICIPGHFQMVIILNKLFNLKKEQQYREAALRLFNTAQEKQFLIPLKGIYGGFAGSGPIWGKYLRGKLPNWAVKFYLDAAYSF